MLIHVTIKASTWPYTEIRVSDFDRDKIQVKQSRTKNRGEKCTLLS